jgi:hypothetical protein
MKKTFACCGVDCAGCHLYPEQCAGCAAIEGKVYWLAYTGEAACSIYECCVNQKKLQHCGLCDKLPCENYQRDDPSKSPEENAADHRMQIANLRKLAEENE